MPAVSKAQQKLFGIVHAIQKGGADPSKFSPTTRKLAAKMSHADVKKYATTKIKDLPKKIREILASDETAIGGTPVTDTPPASTEQPHISNDPKLVTFDEDYSEKQNKILSVVKDKRPIEIDGTTVDLYTAALLTKVLHKLSPDNRKKMLSLPIEKMVATAYKLVTR
jgi:hypothetical protein